MKPYKLKKNKQGKNQLASKYYHVGPKKSLIQILLAKKKAMLTIISILVIFYATKLLFTGDYENIANTRQQETKVNSISNGKFKMVSINLPKS